jgi:hypothetical protein
MYAIHGYALRFVAMWLTTISAAVNFSNNMEKERVGKWRNKK